MLSPFPTGFITPGTSPFYSSTTLASFSANAIEDIAVHPTTGDIYIADGLNNRIRRVTPAGVTSIFAGSGAATTTNGTGLSAAFNYPGAIAFNATGDKLYVGEAFGFVIREISVPGAVVTTLAGLAGVSGDVNGTGSAARFQRPTGITVDSSGVLYVCDFLSNKIKRITAAGVVTTYAGSGASGNTNNVNPLLAEFDGPYKCSVSPIGELYVTCATTKALRKIAPGPGAVIDYSDVPILGYIDGAILSARYSSPSGMCIDYYHNVYIADQQNQRVRKIDYQKSLVSTISGNGTNASVNSPNPLVGSHALPIVVDVFPKNTDPEAFYVVDYGTGQLRKLTVNQPITWEPPTTLEKENWFTGVGTTDYTLALPRRDIQQMISDATGLDISEILYSSSLSDDLAMTLLDPETAYLITAFETGFPQVDWTSYSGTLNSWYDFFSDDFNGTLVEDICNVWADAENKKLLIYS